jgi:hypothetical protein
MTRVLASLLVAIFLSTAFAHAESQLSAEQARELATRLANEECQRRFDSSPFKATTAIAHLINGRWHWNASAGFTRADLVADVCFSLSGERPSVVVELRTGIGRKAGFLRSF